MAGMAIADLEAAVAVEPRHTQRPPEAYTRTSNRLGPVVLATLPETLEMSQLRQRLQTGSSPAAPALEEDSSPEASPTLTPTSTAEVRGEALGKENQGQERTLGGGEIPTKSITEGSGLPSIVKTVPYSLLTRFKSISSPRPTPEEVQELNKSRGFDKLNYEKGMPCGSNILIRD
jgi:hypothetical protein